MNSFFYRDSRLQRLESALAALTPDLEALRPLLERELAILATGDWRVTDRAYLAAAADMLWPISLTLLMVVEGDPVLAALGEPPPVTADQAAAVETLPRGPGGPRPEFVDQVRAAVGADAAAFTALVHTGHRVWLEQSADAGYLFDDVGVLLPLRLETLFDPPVSEHNDDPLRWKLSLRVMPDEASICRDNRHVGAGERQALALFWQAVQQPGTPDPAWLEGDTAAVAWQQLCARVAPPRAAWLVGALDVQFDGDAVTVQLPDDMPAAPEPNRVGGLPPALRVVALTKTPLDGAIRHSIGRLPMDEAASIDTAALTLPLPGAPDDTQHSWWASWETAQAAGLGGAWLLPEGMTPDNIDALIVAGIGDEAPDAHFNAQADAGELAVLPLGAPTNSVHGAPAADLGRTAADWRRIAQMRLRQRLGQGAPLDAGQAIQHYLLGADGGLPFFAGADSADSTHDSRLLARALWPALWGHWLRDLWQLGDDAHRIGNWAADNLCPEGPLMPIRIGDQPYGLLPVTALSDWRPAVAFSADDDAQGRLEALMAAKLADLRHQWAGAARRTRTVAGQDSAAFMRLLGQDALSRRYVARDFTPAWAQRAPYQLAGDLRDKFDDAVRTAYQMAGDQFERDSVNPYLAAGLWRPTRLPLVQPARWLYGHRHGEVWRPVTLSRFLTILFEDLGPNNPPEELDLERIFRNWWWVLDDDGEWQLGGLPNSLLIRLLVYATQLAALWRRAPSGSGPERRLFKTQQDGALTLAGLLDDPAWQVEDFDPVHERPIFTVHIPDERRAQLERALRATLDSAASRLDPWVTGFAWQRLRQHSASPRRAYRLGAFGWVDGPFGGRPGPTEAGRLHTPSYNQTLAAIILRDRFLSSDRTGAVNESGRNPWEMNITAAKARLAEAIAAEVRLGGHILEIIGRYVEQVLGAHQAVKELRTSDRYAMRPERHDPAEVCHGLRALTGLLKGGDPDARLSAADLHPDAPPNDDPAFPLTPDQRDQLKLLHHALDVYGDLLMADGVMQLVNRQTERAAETMDAAAGFAQPPSFEFLRTPPSGYQLESLVLSVLPFVPVNSLPGTATPARLADPSVAAFLDDTLGAAWSWRAFDPVDDTALGAISLAELGLAPVDTLALSDEFLRDLARHTLGLPEARIEAPRAHRLAQQLVVALGSRPAAGRDVADESAEPAIGRELARRYRRLRQAARRTIRRLSKTPASPAQQRAAIREALTWGLTPIGEPAQRDAFFAASPAATHPPGRRLWPRSLPGWRPP
jgi:hypothetical protein